MAFAKRSASTSALLALSVLAGACGGGAAPEAPVEAAATAPPGVPLTVAPTSAVAAVPVEDVPSEALAFEEPSADEMAAQAAIEAERAAKVAEAKALLAAEREAAAAAVGQVPEVPTGTELETETEPDPVEEEPTPPPAVTEIAPLASFVLDGGAVVSSSPEAPDPVVVNFSDTWLAGLEEADRQTISTLHILPPPEPGQEVPEWEISADQIDGVLTGTNTVYVRFA